MDSQEERDKKVIVDLLKGYSEQLRNVMNAEYTSPVEKFKAMVSAINTHITQLDVTVKEFE